MNNLHAAQKEQRLERQRVTLALILALPVDEQTAALFEAWPQRIPKTVWTVLSRQQKHAWQALRQEKWDTNDEPEQDDGLAVYREFGGEAAVTHRQGIDEVLGLCQSVQGTKRLVIVFEDPLDDEDPAQSLTSSYLMSSQGEINGLSNSVPLDEVLAFCLYGQGTLTIRQELALKVQQRDAQGQKVWVAQERMYGVQMSEGHWSTMSPTEMRLNCRNQAGKGPLPAGISFGDLKEVVKRQG